MGTTMIMSVLVSAWTAILPAQEAASAARDANRLAEPQEKRFNDVQPPELVMDILGIRPGLVIGEVGAGHGRITVHLAARVGDKGKVYANDIDPAAVDYLKARCRRQGLANVETILSLPDDARFPQNTLDLVVMTWVYHHVDNPVPLLKSLLPSLKPWGFVALVEPKPAEHGLQEGRALTQESVGEEARAAGFSLDGVIEDRLQTENVFILRPVVPEAPGSQAEVDNHGDRGGAPDGDEEEPLGLTYIANAGVLVASGGLKVLVDALFDKPNPEYRSPAPDVLEKIRKGAVPFDGVDLVLVTHNHPDHFDASLAVHYLESLPEPLLLAPADAVAEMRKAAADWTKIEARVIPLDIKVGEKDKRDLKQIPVTAFRTRHSGDQDSPMNLMYLFDLDGWRVLHEGDSTGKPDDFQRFGLGGAPVDLALVHFWFPLEPNCARFLQEVLKPGHIALKHLPIRLESDAPGKIDQVRGFYKDIFLLLPGMPDRVFPK